MRVICAASMSPPHRTRTRSSRVPALGDNPDSVVPSAVRVLNCPSRLTSSPELKTELKGVVARKCLGGERHGKDDRDGTYVPAANGCRTRRDVCGNCEVQSITLPCRSQAPIMSISRHSSCFSVENMCNQFLRFFLNQVSLMGFYFFFSESVFLSLRQSRSFYVYCLEYHVPLSVVRLVKHEQQHL